MHHYTPDSVGENLKDYLFKKEVKMCVAAVIFLGVYKFSTTYAIVLFSRHFNENLIIKYDFYEVYHSHSTPKGASVCAIRSKSFDWEKQPKLVQK